MLRVARVVGINVRLYSVKAAKKDAKKYTDTINLPKTKFPNRLTAAKREEVENKILNKTIASAYQYQEQHKSTPSFVLHDGPPYANGELHMGHAVNKILKDITLRQRVAQGQRISYIPGWDCHGLPIELKAMGSADVAKNPLDIRKKSRAFAFSAIDSQKEEFRSWGVLADWERENLYMTFQPDFISKQLQMFYNLYERGLVYRDLKPVYWSPSSRTALAEAELEYDANFISPSVYVRFALNGVPDCCTVPTVRQIYALVWTTTPWTLPSNQAICYNAALEYALVRLPERAHDELYMLATNLIKDFEAATQLSCNVVQKFSGTALNNFSYRHPIHQHDEQALPFYAASHVQDTKGTGLVHTAPAHGPEDFLVSLQQELPVKNYVNDAGVYTQDAPTFLRGQAVLEQGDKLVMQHIARDVVHASKLEHAYPIDWRTKKPVIIRASDQWFINTEKLKARAAKALEQVKIYPRVNADANKKALLTQLHKRPYWCISRQRAWGVPIPVLYLKDSGKVVVNAELIKHFCKLLHSEGSIDFWWSKPISELVPEQILAQLKCKAADLVRGTDIFDIWFDSGSTWFAVLKDQKIADLYLEGYDQFTGWFQSSLLTSIAARECAPYKALFVHGFTVDEKGHKMSKSLGNVISPKQITKKYGTDVLRWWVALHGTQHMSIIVSEKLLQQASENLGKVRGTLRYLNGVLENGKDMPLALTQTSYLNKYLLSNLVEFETEIDKQYNCYEYNRVVASIQNFVTNQISAIYVHLIKDRLYCGDAKELQDICYTLSHCYRQLCKALWPIAPYLVEESWSYYDKSGRAFHEQHVQANSDWFDTNANNVVNAALDLKRAINQQAGDVNSWYLSVTVNCGSSEQLELLSALQSKQNVPIRNSELCEILQVASLNLQGTISSDTLVKLETLSSTLCPRCRRFCLHEAENEICMRCSSILSQ